MSGDRVYLEHVIERIKRIERYTQKRKKDFLNSLIIQDASIQKKRETQILSFGKARALAQMNKWEFHDELARRNVIRHYNLDDLKEDLKYGES